MLLGRGCSRQRNSKCSTKTPHLPQALGKLQRWQSDCPSKGNEARTMAAQNPNHGAHQLTISISIIAREEKQSMGPD